LPYLPNQLLRSFPTTNSTPNWPHYSSTTMLQGSAPTHHLISPLAHLQAHSSFCPSAVMSASTGSLISTHIHTCRPSWQPIMSPHPSSCSVSSVAHHSALITPVAQFASLRPSGTLWSLFSLFKLHFTTGPPSHISSSSTAFCPPFHTSISLFTPSPRTGTLLHLTTLGSPPRFHTHIYAFFIILSFIHLTHALILVISHIWAHFIHWHHLSCNHLLGSWASSSFQHPHSHSSFHSHLASFVGKPPSNQSTSFPFPLPEGFPFHPKRNFPSRNWGWGWHGRHFISSHPMCRTGRTLTVPAKFPIPIRSPTLGLGLARGLASTFQSFPVGASVQCDLQIRPIGFAIPSILFVEWGATIPFLNL